MFNFLLASRRESETAQIRSFSISLINDSPYQYHYGYFKLDLFILICNYTYNLNYYDYHNQYKY